MLAVLHGKEGKMITKGKWQIEQQRKWPYNLTIRSNKDTCIADCPLAFISTEFRVIDNVYGQGREDNEEVLANAQAISAVPDMIEALKEVALFGFTYCIDADADRYRVSIPIETRDKITVALAKAGIK
jgi:hypothetical protein